MLKKKNVNTNKIGGMAYVVTLERNQFVMKPKSTRQGLALFNAEMKEWTDNNEVESTPYLLVDQRN